MSSKMKNLHSMTWSSPSRSRKSIFDLKCHKNNTQSINVLYRDGSYPTVTSHVGSWSLNPSHSLDWSIPHVSASDTRSGSLEFNIGGDDVGVFFPVKVQFVGQGSMAGLKVQGVQKVESGEDAVFSVDDFISTEEYSLV
jgi:hypothetical protein